ncbi:hypothetical protein CNMCM8980_006355 [Aspergillus fumigatiaffinis]|uniref:Uncharacterized protein n=1 Tax=Aspergillus fumigatiaffinis TaxID=340414 RepID=A0A8H4GGR8_9EURO|nr:hypothetical protein CNMCM5878_006217 [Aspergillus fumigatiaffinis]KAF4218733.1 hypothetical protein CNMCM6457_003639 [Aspergillus fumigatiaffinis]KAF4225892.1 hypothetical protein CNMCM6805_005786 [Aspergillus fumigatiaffinis]KAF4229281.1 hypothetical protein CNMCM8980_006355 [Aspergillus fumigatiaffinis]
MTKQLLYVYLPNHNAIICQDHCLQLLTLPQGVQPQQDYIDFLACGIYLSSSAWQVWEHHYQHHPTVCWEDPWQVVGVPSAQPWDPLPMQPTSTATTPSQPQTAQPTLALTKPSIPQHRTDKEALGSCCS